MAITGITYAQQEELEERQDPYMRLVYAIGILLTMFGHMIPGDVKWTMVGVALVVFYWIY
jgi:hypothetical protein